MSRRDTRKNPYTRAPLTEGNITFYKAKKGARASGGTRKARRYYARKSQRRYIRKSQRHYKK